MMQVLCITTIWMFLQEMLFQFVSPARFEITQRAGEGQYIRMNSFVPGQGRVFNESLITELAFKQAFFLVSALMSSHKALFGSSVGTIWMGTAFQNVSSMDTHVCG